MPKESYYKQVVTRLYEQSYKDVKSLTDKNYTEADFIRDAIDRHIVYIKRQKSKEVQS